MKNLKKLLMNACVMFVLLMLGASVSSTIEDVIYAITSNFYSMLAQVFAVYTLAIALSAAEIYLSKLVKDIVNEVKVSFRKTKKTLQQKAAA